MLDTYSPASNYCSQEKFLPPGCDSNTCCEKWWNTIVPKLKNLSSECTPAPTPPPDISCAKCLENSNPPNTWKSCDALCKAAGTGTGGYCYNIGSSDPHHCCACTNSPTPLPCPQFSSDHCCGSYMYELLYELGVCGGMEGVTGGSDCPDACCPFMTWTILNSVAKCRIDSSVRQFS